jgi:murein DD-endopeptidase MepM/ murein hydrolase activator NlpD
LSVSFFYDFSKLDYYSLKIENKILKAKIANITAKAYEALDWFDSVKKAHNQIAKITNLDRFDYTGGPTYRETEKFRKIVENIDYTKFNEKDVISSYERVRSESEKTLGVYNELLNYITTKLNHQRAFPSGIPCEGSVTSGFGYRVHPFTLLYDFHTGIDISNEPGTDIKSTADGVVRYVGWSMGYGLCVIIDHGFGYSTLYGHLSQALVKEGDIVKRGSVIAKLGSTGTSTGPHLHYEVWEYGVPKNPVNYINNFAYLTKK